MQMQSLVLLLLVLIKRKIISKNNIVFVVCSCEIIHKIQGNFITVQAEKVKKRGRIPERIPERSKNEECEKYLEFEKLRKF